VNRAELTDLEPRELRTARVPAARKVPVGVIGVGYLGRLHAQKYVGNPRTRLVGVYDTDHDRALQVAAEVGSVAFESLDALLGRVEAVSIAAPTSLHFALARRCLEAGLHVLVEKPLTETIEQADELLALQQRSGLILAAGHLKRVHPAIELLRSMKLGPPLLFEAERYAPFRSRSLDVDVVLDLMVHDLDLALHFIGEQPTEVQAVGAAVLTPRTDVATAFLKFPSRAVARLSASRVHHSTIRRARIEWEACSASIDFLDNRLVIQECDPGNGNLQRERELPIPPVDLLWQQIDAFVDGTEGGDVACNGREARDALALAIRVSESVRAAPDRTR
jgi:predicted dehydrogenase